MRNCTKLLLIALTAGVTSTASAVTVSANLIRDYPLLSDPNGLLGGPMVTLGAGSSFNGDGLEFGANAGPRIIGSSSTPLFPSGPVTDYSIAFDLTLTSPSYQATTTTTTDPFFGTTTTQTTYPFVKLIDFNNLTVDAGLYINNDGVLEFKTLGTFGTDIIAPDTEYHFAFTRDSTNGLQAYINGVSQFSPLGNDTNGEAIINSDSLAFLLDDTETTDPMAAGILSFVEIYTGTLTDQEVMALAAESAARNAVPNPASLLLFAFGLLVARRKSRVVES